MGELAILLRALRPQIAWMALGTALGFAVGLAVVGLMAASAQFLVVTALAGGVWTPLIHQANAGIRLAAAVRTLGRYGERLYSHEATFRVLAELRVWFFRRLAPLAPARLQQLRSGDLLDRIVGDIDALASFYVRLLSPTVVALALGGAATLILWAFGGDVALVAGAMVAVVVVLISALAARLGAAARRLAAAEARRLRTRWLDAVTGLSELTLFGATALQIRALDEEGDALLEAARRQIRVAGGIEALSRAAAGLGFVAVLWVAVESRAAEALWPAHVPIVAMVALTLSQLVAPLPLAFLELSGAREAMSRVAEIVDAEPVAPEPLDDEGVPKDSALRVEDVSFAYSSGGATVLRGVSFELAPGDKLALLGATGSGKTTLSSLLLRFWDPTSGRVTIGGTDLRRLREEDLRSLVTAVPQRPHLFEGTLRYNLRLGRPDASDEELEEVLAAVRLDGLVEELPDRLDTDLGPGGARLSTGQVRRVALARALLRETPLLVLDEPTEGLDDATADRLLTSLAEATADRTVVHITHRLPSPDTVDRIVVLDRGRVLEQGTHEELLIAGGRYAELRARHQRG